ncbi:hypothetical protein XJ44_02210 [Thermosipho affectus]|uniref:Uncharacterized protein n=1 Tax=Thermosipho affectus TaxID=660294 RepID=A0ABX3IJ00_9BACT|nr:MULTISPECIES: hypothetical protein [Thermosipho]ANQ53336.1 hypothetical protein Y592_02245 [Thermosipho sp. 1070]APT71786.1 hypothetical protein BG95_02235 [Thermosipho sp. 1063]ONN27801.1 hypothetical protein XJ44_02210 [Thermosipho affectus]OOC45291.1 hypothetical protein XO08_02225 [Thermosipho sp. 1074]
MRIAFISLLILLVNVVVLLSFLVVKNLNSEIVEIQSPPFVLFVNPYFDYVRKFKNMLIMQKILSENLIYGDSPFLVESKKVLDSVEYYFKIFKVDYRKKYVLRKYWWGSIFFEALIYDRFVFYYVPHIRKGESNLSFGEAVIKVLKGESVNFDVKNKIEEELLKKYGVVKYD